jgi:hypothetical protein
MLLPSSGSKSKPRKNKAKQIASRAVLGLIFDLENRGNMFLQNIS